MDKTSVFGLILAFVAIGTGMVLKGVNLSVLLNPAAILIILAGTTATILIGFPTSEVKNIPKLFKVVFTEEKGKTEEDYIQIFTELATIARKEGLLALESKVDEMSDQFLKNGISLAIDGQSAEFIKDVLMDEIQELEERHQASASIFTQAGTYAPTLGVLGAVVGLIAALANLSDIDKLGHAIAAAFVATLLGIFTGYVLWHPFANKLKRKSKQEIKMKQLITVGILSVQGGESPIVIKQKLASCLPNERRKAILAQGEITDVKEG